MQLIVLMVALCGVLGEKRGKGTVNPSVHSPRPSRGPDGNVQFPNSMSLTFAVEGEASHEVNVNLLNGGTKPLAKNAPVANQAFAAYTSDDGSTSLVTSCNGDECFSTGIVHTGGRACVVEGNSNNVVCDYKPVTADVIDQVKVLLDNDPTGGEDIRKKRGVASGDYFLEVCCTADYGFYEWFVSRFSTPVLTSALYLTAVYNQANVYFSSIGGSDYNVFVQLIDYNIPLSLQEQPSWSRPFNIRRGVGVDANSIFQYLPGYASKYFDHDACDAVMALTGYDLWVSQNDILGVVMDFRSTCDTSIHYAITEDGLLTGLVLAHEFGHQLGAYHDTLSEGLVFDPECASNTYVMTPGLATYRPAGDTWDTFSNCSQVNIEAFITSEAGSCLSSNYNESVYEPFTTQTCVHFPGELLSLDDQCHQVLGDSFSGICAQYMPAIYSDICTGDYYPCGDNRYCYKILIQDGTDCSLSGDGSQVCFDGVCVDNDASCPPATPAPTISGPIVTTQATQPPTCSDIACCNYSGTKRREKCCLESACSAACPACGAK